MRSWGRIGALFVLLALCAGASRAEPTLEPAPGDERLDYVWRIEGFKGFFLRLVAPGRGEGTLTTVLNERGHYETELHISAESRRRGDFYLYGSAIDPATRRSVRAWTAQKIGDKSKSRRADLASEDVIDLASGILLVRRDPPREPRRMRIWSNGNMYSVILEPTGASRMPFRGRLAEVRGYAIRGDRVPGERQWKGGLELYLADDPSATPVEIFVLNKGVRVRLILDQESSQFGLPETRRVAAGG